MLTDNIIHWLGSHQLQKDVPRCESAFIAQMCIVTIKSKFVRMWIMHWSIIKRRCDGKPILTLLANWRLSQPSRPIWGDESILNPDKIRGHSQGEKFRLVSWINEHDVNFGIFNWTSMTYSLRATSTERENNRGSQKLYGLMFKRCELHSITLIFVTLHLWFLLRFL